MNGIYECLLLQFKTGMAIIKFNMLKTQRKQPRPFFMYYTGKRVVRFAENNSVVPPRPAPPSPECWKLGCRLASKALQYAAEQCRQGAVGVTQCVVLMFFSRPGRRR